MRFALQVPKRARVAAISSAEVLVLPAVDGHDRTLAVHIERMALCETTAAEYAEGSRDLFADVAKQWKVCLLLCRKTLVVGKGSTLAM